MPNKSQINEYSSELKRQDKACQFLDASFEVLTTNFRKDCPELLYYNPSHDRFKIPHHSSSISCHSSIITFLYLQFYSCPQRRNYLLTSTEINPPSLADQVRKKNLLCTISSEVYIYISTKDFNNVSQTCAPPLQQSPKPPPNHKSICQKQTKCPENSVSYPIYEAPIARPLISWF